MRVVVLCSSRRADVSFRPNRREPGRRGGAQAWIKDLGIGPKSTFVVYIIRVQRIKDGASCVSAQRYSELRSLYNHLKVPQQQCARVRARVLFLLGANQINPSNQSSSQPR